MKDEIKEIINDLQRVADRKCYPEDILDGSIAQEWVDYITNLQESEAYYYGYYKDYKSRIDKAIEFVYKMIEQEPANSSEYDFYCNKLLNILKGDTDGSNK